MEMNFVGYVKNKHSYDTKKKYFFSFKDDDDTI